MVYHWFSDRKLLEMLIMLIGKSTDSQTVFGKGNTDSYVSTSYTGVLNSGSMNEKGLFWGSNDAKSGVKVFVGYQNRLHPGICEVKKTLEAGELGRILSVEAVLFQ